MNPFPNGPKLTRCNATLDRPPKIDTEGGFDAMPTIFEELENHGSTGAKRESFEGDSKKKSAILSVDSAGKD